MKRTLLSTLLVITLFTTATSPALAVHNSLSATSNALPLLETVPIRGTITAIDGGRVQIKPASGDMQIYRISKGRQQRYGLEVGSEVTLGVRRLNNAVITINES